MVDPAHSLNWIPKRPALVLYANMQQTLGSYSGNPSNLQGFLSRTLTKPSVFTVIMNIDVHVYSLFIVIMSSVIDCSMYR